MQAAKYIGAGLAAIGLTGAGKTPKYAKTIHTGVDNFFDLVFESDNGQLTDNVFIIAQRFIQSGQAPDADIINRVLRLQGNNKIDSEMINIFEKLYNQRTTFERVPIDREGMVKFRSLSDKGKPAGVYIFKDKTNGELCVGSSKDLIIRVRDHYYGRTHGRLAQHIEKYGADNYSVSVTVLPDNLVTTSNILALEQYLLFLLNPSINFLKVVNSSNKVYTDQEVEKLREHMGHKLYVYYKGVLVYVFGSVNQCFKELEESNNFTYRVLVRAKGIYRQDILFTKTEDMSASRQLMELDDFKALFSKVKKANKRVQAMPSNTQTVKTTHNRESVQHVSLAAATKWLIEKTGKSVSRATLTNSYLDKDKEYLGYKLERVRLDDPGYIVSQDTDE